MVEFHPSAIRRLSNRVIFPLLAGLATAFLFLIVVALRDERISRKETIFAFIGGASALGISFLLLRNVNFVSKSVALAAGCAVAIAIAGVGFKPLPLPAQLFFLSGVQTQILDLEPDTEVELYWTYWSDGEAKDEDNLDTPRSLKDIGYGEFRQVKNWSFNDQGILRTDEKGAALDFLSEGLHSAFPVLNFRTSGGDALIYFVMNGRKSFFSIDGDFLDATPTFVRPNLRLHRAFAFLTETAAIGFTLFPVLAALFGRFLRK